MYKESDLTQKIIGIAMRIHREIGPGFQERIYYKAMVFALNKENLNIESEKEYNIYFDDTRIGTFRADLVIENKVIIELKAVVGEMPKIFQTQTISYLKASGLEIGLLINFNNQSLEVKRLANYKNYKKFSGISK